MDDFPTSRRDRMESDKKLIKNGVVAIASVLIVGMLTMLALVSSVIYFIIKAAGKI